MVTPASPRQDNPAAQVPDGLIDTVRAMRAPIIVSHVVPDADALGSMLSWAIAWTSKDCRPNISLPEGSLSQRLRFLFDWARVPVALPEDFAAADGFVVLDTAKKPRCNIDPSVKKTDWWRGGPVVNIDHHATNTMFGDLNWVVEHAGSTSELVYYLLCEAQQPLVGAAPSLLYAGIHTDTLGFTLPTTTSWALKAAADLIDAGADVAELGKRLYRSQTQSEFALLRVIYENTQVIANGRLSYSSASYDEIHSAGCTAADIDDQINVPCSVEGVRMSILFTEGRKGKTRINFRSSGNVTIVDLAAAFDGGGHAQAAGAVLDCALDEAMTRVLPNAEAHLENY